MKTISMPIVDSMAGASLELQLQRRDLEEHLSNISEIPQNMQDEIASLPKESVLISLIAQEQALYNPKHENYRSAQCKEAKWTEIADNIGWSGVQCKAKWKAMRDQYCRELKRSKLNSKAVVKWKYFKELDFLRPFALSRNYRPRNSLCNPHPVALPPVSAASDDVFGTTLINIDACGDKNNTRSHNHNRNNQSLPENNTDSTGNQNKFDSTIKIESGSSFNPCEFVTTTGIPSSTTTATTIGGNIKTEAVRLLTPLTDEQLNNVMQQQQGGHWNYLTASPTSATPATTNPTTPTRLANGLELLQHPQPQQQQQHQDEVFYNAFVECVTAAAAVSQLQQQQHQQQQQTQLHQMQVQNPEEEDEDPIHTFLNIESYFEKELILMIQQEDILYNSYHPNYRNVKMKLEVWDDIAHKLKKTVKQCRLKWKALRDQYIREHKRLKNRDNVESLPRWKHYDALNFLQKFIKHKTSELDIKPSALLLPKADMDVEMDDHLEIREDSPLEASMGVGELVEQQRRQEALLTLPSLTGPHLQTHKQDLPSTRNDSNICIVSAQSVGGYDEMDIENFIIGDASDDQTDEVVDENDDEVDGGEDEEDRKSQQHFPDFCLSASKEKPTLVSESDEVVKPCTDEDRHNFTSVEPSPLRIASVSNAEESLHNSSPQDCMSAMAQALVNGLTAVEGSGAAGSACSNSSHGLFEPPSDTKAGLVRDDDEVGAFFKAIAMKIRNVKMSAVAFTELQIDILRVINGSLRNGV